MSLSKEDSKQISDTIETSSLYRWLKLKDEHAFGVGDILVKQSAVYEDGSAMEEKIVGWKTQNISSKSKVPRKYKVVHVDEFGVPYVKVISAAGPAASKEKLGNELICIALSVMNSYFTVRYTVDPEYAEHILLSGENEKFDPTREIKVAKQERRKIAKQNRALREKMGTLDEINDFVKDLKKKDVLYVSRRHKDDEARDNQFTVKKIVKMDVKRIKESRAGGRFSNGDGIPYNICDFMRSKESETLSNNTVYMAVGTYKHLKDGYTWEDNISVVDLVKSYVYKTRPKSYETL